MRKPYFMLNFVRIAFLSMTLASPLSHAKTCVELLSLKPTFLIEGRVVSFPITELVRDRSGVRGGTHAFYVEQDVFEGFIGVRFLEHLDESSVNLNQKNKSLDDAFLSGSIGEDPTSGRLMLIIDRIWYKEKLDRTLDLDSSSVISLGGDQ